MDTLLGSGGKELYSGFGLTSGFMGLAIDGDGKYVAVGYTSNFVSALYWDTLTARIGSAGGLDTLFSSNGYDVYDTGGSFTTAGGVEIQPDGKLVVASTVGTGSAMLLRYTTAGALDTSFGSDGVVTTNIATGSADTWVGIGHTWDGKIVVSGYANGDFAAGRYFSGVGLNQRLYVQQDANFNVTSVSNPDGETVERYRYTPYGQRAVLNDDFTADGDNTSDYGLNIGHQGLKHDTETGLIYNRARYLHNSLGRFTAKDPLGTAYQDGMNLYQYVLSQPIGQRDATGRGISDFIKEILNLLNPPQGNKDDFTPKPDEDDTGPRTPPAQYSPLSSSSPECDKYPCDYSYAGSNAKCFCKNAGDSDWSREVRGCLRFYYDQGMGGNAAHATCYAAADAKHPRPTATLLAVYAMCKT